MDARGSCGPCEGSAAELWMGSLLEWRCLPPVHARGEDLRAEAPLDLVLEVQEPSAHLHLLQVLQVLLHDSLQHIHIQ